MLKIERAFEAYLDGINQVTILMPTMYKGPGHFKLQCGAQEWDMTVTNRIQMSEFIKYECSTPHAPILGVMYTVQNEQNETTDLQVGAIIRTSEFDMLYSYDGNDLGITYSKQASVCKVWAPTATAAKLRLYEESKYTDIPMKREENGIWKAIAEGDQDGVRYTILVCINLVWHEAVDPYAKSVSLNGEYGVIVDLEQTKVGSPPVAPLQSYTDAIIYEAHIRDLTMHPNSGIVHKGTYRGVMETATHNRDTGLTYLRNLGITHIELLPLHDFYGIDEANPTAYNWGYNPLHFNAPEGSYASNPCDPYSRIRELKQMIATIHEQGLRVILDVVYNHVYVRETSSFEKLVPGYYFRHDQNGMPSNGTGVGNDIASERRMVRKFIIDSILYWLCEYKVDGFRFDLMGILDWDTMNAIEQAVHTINPNILLLGEGWDLNTPLPQEQKATLRNAHRMPNIAQFNDVFRDTIKGSAFHSTNRGYAFGGSYNRETIQYLLTGSVGLKDGDHALFASPSQSVNYVECHDNATMWDKLWASNKDDTEEVRKRRHMLATGMVILAQGIPFIHAGQEFFRTKQGIENSYNAPDYINQLDWARKDAHEKYIAFIKGLIAIRRMNAAFRLPDAEAVRRHVSFPPAPDGVTIYQLHDIGSFNDWSEICVIFNPTEAAQQVRLPSIADWHILVDGKTVDIAASSALIGNTLVVSPISLWIIAKSG
ncbi:type I pullulanase [Ectobacillus antri]|uniref:Type I pullulanase n=1 Tax=Ectobacillus antri TaxID=2486280 RepID=A0ABT6H505_9BACI|nr:type I pullulanase [Ectobacillus antri]MDG4656471.1 type I pullulanase [Ectobacillus antri]MDG5753521.1 type I pullulanase [Ectobacillus antri]